MKVFHPILFAFSICFLRFWSVRLRSPALRLAFMASGNKGGPLPKFGEWDVNNPASSEGFTVIFNKARNEKKTTGIAANIVQPPSKEPVYNNESFPQDPPVKRRWFCCG